MKLISLFQTLLRLLCLLSYKARPNQTIQTFFPYSSWKRKTCSWQRDYYNSSNRFYFFSRTPNHLHMGILSILFVIWDHSDVNTIVKADRRGYELLPIAYSTWVFSGSNIHYLSGFVLSSDAFQADLDKRRPWAFQPKYSCFKIFIFCF